MAIARALAMEPTVLLLDEPTSALDPQRTETIRLILRRLAGDGLTMLISTHEMRFAREVASRVLVLDQGRVIEDGPPAQVLERPAHDRTRALLGKLAAGEPDGRP